MDAGSGRGRNSVYLARLGWEVLSVDPSVRRLKEAANASYSAGVRLETALGVAERLAVKSEVFDLVVCTHVLESLPVEVARVAVEEFRRALLPGGFLFLAAAATDDGLSSSPDTSDLPFHLYGEEELLEMVSGFKLAELLHLRLARPASAPPSAHWVYVGRKV